MTKGEVIPKWFEGNMPEGSYRSIFKWGDPDAYKHPNQRLYRHMLNVFEMEDEDFSEAVGFGFEEVRQEVPVRLTSKQVDFFVELLGEENVFSDTYTRVKRSYGKGMIDALRLRHEIVENVADLVLAPRNREDVEAIVAFCDEEQIPVYVFGGGSSVTRGTEAVKGGVTLDMGVHMKRVLDFNEKDQTITVEAGMMGPELEALLNEAPSTLQAKRRYTCGHFPQSFEFSSVGGWVVTRGAGQNSTYYGKIEDLVLAQEYVTPIGTLQTGAYARQATGPDYNQIMIGSEGAFGVLTSVTLKLHRYLPEAKRYFATMFASWEDGLAAVREIMQGEFGVPSVFRLSDAEETDVGMKLYGIEGTPADTILKALGFEPMKKCLMLGMVDGDKAYTKTVMRRVKKVLRKYKTFDLTPFKATQRWEHGRFLDPYMREDLNDYGLLIDTLECSVRWDQLEEVHEQVRAFVKNRPKTVCMTHLSHLYPQGANLYFIFIAKMNEIEEYLDLQYGILEHIKESGAAMSHHHGVGKQTSPWLEEMAGSAYMGILRTLKDHFDPHNIMNPGGTLGLDMNEAQANKVWSKDL